MSFTAGLANSLWLGATIPSWLRYQRAVARPADTQEQILQRLLRQNETCAYGKAFDFENVHTYEQFNANVPVVEYEELQPWLTRIMRGQTRVLTSAAVTRLIPTGGSTGGRKLIPFTADLQREFNAAIGPWIVDLFRQYPALVSGSAYWSISPAIPNSIEPSSLVPIGFEDDSHYLGGIQRKLAEATFAAPSALCLTTDIETSQYLTLLCLLRRRDLTLISIWHPSFLNLLMDRLPEWWAELLSDVKLGGCRRASALPVKVQNAVNAAPMPTRLRELREAVPQNPLSVWPQLRLVSCWGDGQSTLSMRALQERLPNIAIQPKGLLATEAFISIPFQQLHPLAITSHFFEFSAASGRIYRAHELELGETYSVIVSTSGGLWRYRLGDMVQVDGFVGDTPSLRFLGRSGNVSDLCGEKLTEPFVTQCIETACRELRFAPQFTMLSPDEIDASVDCYTLFVEGDAPIGFASAVESQLRTNPQYALCRDLGQLGPLRQFRLSEGAYSRFVTVLASEGRKVGDIKPQSLSGRRDWGQKLSGQRVDAN